MSEIQSPSENESVNRSIINGLSPKEGVPGTQIKIRGENLGKSQSDIVALSICGTDCLISAKWKSPSLIIARIGQAKRGVGEVIVVTKSMGRSISTVKFRVFVVQIDPLEESAVWVDESRSVPGREAVRNIPEILETEDALGLRIESVKKMDQNEMLRLFPDSSGNRRMENFSAVWYLLENDREARMSELRKGLANLQRKIDEGGRNTVDIHRANLYSLINCVDALATFHDRLQIERNTRSWPLTKNIREKLEECQITADALFHEVLSRKDRADATRNALSVLMRFRFIFFLPSAIDQNLAKGEYSSILNDYTRIKSLFKDTEVPLFKEVMQELNCKMEVFKKNMKQQLINIPTSFEEQSKLIKYLKVLEPESDPAWECITAYHCWLEDLLWQVQFKHHEIAVAERRGTNAQHKNEVFSLVDGTMHGLMDFVQEIVNVITDKLQTFWKLSQVYSSSATVANFFDRQADINQMLINTINVSSWLMLNALVPPLSAAVMNQYKEQFVVWPTISPSLLTQQLFSSLKVLRLCISTMLEHNFTTEHLQPLIELSLVVRIKCLTNVFEGCIMGITALDVKENWKIDFAQNDSTKTGLPDLYENEINNTLPSVNNILSFSNFHGEVDLFARETFRSKLINLFTQVLTSFGDCIENLLRIRSDLQRPSVLVGDSSPNSKKLLISICNIEYVINNSIFALCRRLTDNGMKYGDVILEESKSYLLNLRQNLINHYLKLKCFNFPAMVQSASYTDLLSDDASDYIKEILMNIVFIQSELCSLAPHIMHQVMCPAARLALRELIARLSVLFSLSCRQATQVVVDVSAFEESLQNFLSLESKMLLNSLRMDLIKDFDRSFFQESLRNFRASMRMVISTLTHEFTVSINDTCDI